VSIGLPPGRCRQRPLKLQCPAVQQRGQHLRRPAAD